MLTSVRPRLCRLLRPYPQDCGGHRARASGAEGSGEEAGGRAGDICRAGRAAAGGEGAVEPAGLQVPAADGHGEEETVTVIPRKVLPKTSERLVFNP